MNTNLKLSKTLQISIKMVTITILVLLLLIPKFMIEDLVNERHGLKQKASDEVAKSWARDQLITEPYIIIPYCNKAYNEEKKQNQASKSQIIVFPESSTIDGSFITSNKKRSIFDILLYESKINISGQFTIPTPKELNVQNENILWNEASLFLPINDIKGIVKQVNCKFNNTSQVLKPTISKLELIGSDPLSNEAYGRAMSNIYSDRKSYSSGLSTNLEFDHDKITLPFDVELELKGSNSLMFSPLAKNSEIKLSSSFTNPSFVGEFLPSHNLSASGFDADWKVLEYNKSIPTWIKDSQTLNLEKNTFGLIIHSPVDNYTKTSRACKYMILFIALIFLSVLITELINNIRIHIFQYTLVGLALVLFFALLLSLSEFLYFNKSYILSASSIILMIYFYSLSLFQTRSSSYLLTSLCVSLFGYIFIIIQLEQLALLVGTIGLFIILGMCMYVTRKISWNEGD